MSVTAPTETLLAARGVWKRFGGQVAVRDLDLELRPGRIQGLIGPNGAGKSTAVGMLTGRLQPDEGTVELRGEPIRLRSARWAMGQGIIVVPQELAVPDPLTVAQFINLGLEPTTLGMIGRRAEKRAAREVLERLSLEIPVDVPIGGLLPSEQKALVVARALHHEAAALLLDEPTAGMSQVHAEPLLALLERLREEKIAVLYISHRLLEVERICDSVTSMRDGAKVAELTAAEATFEALRGQLEMGNEDVHDIGRGPAVAADAEQTCVVEDLAGERLDGVSFAARRGEVLGLAGLPGSGVEEAFATLAGIGSTAGRVTMEGKRVGNPLDATAAGVGYLPPSRPATILPDDSVPRNMVIGALGKVARGAMVSKRREREVAASVSDRVDVTRYLDRRMGQLSGGNQQKALFGRLLIADSKVLVLEGPTVGVDISARRALHVLIRDLAGEGRTCIVGSEEPGELAALCDRILVFRGGKLTGELIGDSISEREVLGGMTGGERGAPDAPGAADAPGEPA
jgi:ribose transport system ATP-binding protein